MYEFTTSIEISDLLLAVLGLIGCIGAYVGIFFISEIDHNRKYREGLRGAEFDHNDAKGVALISHPFALIGAWCGFYVFFAFIELCAELIYWLMGNLWNIF